MGSQDEWMARAAAVFPGGTFGEYHPPRHCNRVLVRGEGPCVYDADGRRYIDLVLGSGSLVLGHRHPELEDAARKMLEHSSNFHALNPWAIALAEQIVAAAPCGERLRFAVTGTEATLMAMRLARAYTGRNQILKFEGAFHGSHDYAVQSLMPDAQLPYPQPLADSAGIPPGTTASMLIAPFNDLARTAQVVETHGADLAAILVEPLQRVLAPRRGFLQGLRRLADQSGALLIFDEMVTGFRLAWGGAQERYGVTADLAAYGKAIGGGYPIGAVVGRAQIMDAASIERHGSPGYVFTSGTFAGYPMGTGVGLKCLEVLSRPGNLDALQQIGRTVRDGIEELGRRYGLPVQALGDGPLFAIAFADRPIETYWDLHDSDQALSRTLGERLLDEGLLVNPGGKMYLSLAHDTDVVEQILACVERALRKVAWTRV